MKKSKPRSFEVRVPASSANLGAGFDCFGLALELFLTVRATEHSEPGARSEARSRGVSGSEALPSASEENLILRAMRHAAERHGLHLPPVHLAVQNQIPIAGGLGSSAAAIVAGIALGFAVCGRKLTTENALRLASELEQHTDNVGAALLGALVVSFVDARGNVVALRKNWPKQIRVVAVTPKMTLQTAASRAALPQTVEHAAAVHNLQRSALFLAALRRSALRPAVGCHAGSLTSIVSPGADPRPRGSSRDSAHARSSGRRTQRCRTNGDRARH